MNGAFRLRSTGATLLALLLGACGGSPRPAPGPFVAPWLGTRSVAPTAAEMERLSAAGAKELFVAAATLAWPGGTPRIEASALARPARPVAATLVVSGVWTKPRESRRVTARAWRAAIDGMVHGAEQSGYAPVGVHFDLELSTLEDLAATLESLREELPASLRLSVAVDRSQLGSEPIAELARAVDLLVIDAWGQAPTANEDRERWDIDRSLEAIDAAEQLGRSYALSVWTTGAAWHVGSGGRRLESANDLGVDAPLGVPGAERRPGDLLQGIDRQVYEWRFRQPAKIGGHEFSAGDGLRISRPATADLESFLERAAKRASARRVGTIFRELPAANEPLALTAENLAAALEPGAAVPELVAAVENLGRSGRLWRFRVTLANRGAEPTDFGGPSSNFLELRLDGAVVRHAEGGDFGPVEQLWNGTESRTLRALREADTLRLYLPMLPAGGRAASGTIVIAAPNGTAPRIRTGGSFLVARGGEIEVPARVWDLGG